MGNIDKQKIQKKGFDENSKEYKIEDYCINIACSHTDYILNYYKQLPESRDGKYINSDLMKMTFPFYAKNFQNRTLYNMSITNSAAVLTNEAYMRAIQNPNTQKCIYITGPYGAGKSFFSQSLFEDHTDGLLNNSIVYEGSITAPHFGEKIQFAIDNGVTPYIIALNPTLELSLKNIKERFKTVGRDVEKKEALDKFANFYYYMKCVIDKFENITYTIYNKESNIPINLNEGSKNLQDLYHGSMKEIEAEYDRLIKIINSEPSQNDDLPR